MTDGTHTVDAADITRYVESKRLKIVYVPITDVQQHPDNPNNGDVAAIAESIEVNGLYAPVVVQKSTGYILAGNHRYVALLSQGVAEIPVIYRDVDEDGARRIMVADNRINRIGFDDPGLLAEQLEALFETDEGLAGTGFNDAEYLRALEEVGTLDSADDEDDVVPEEPEVPDEGEALKAQQMRFWIEPDIDPDDKVRVVRITKQEGKVVTARDYNTIRQALGHDPLTLQELHDMGVPSWENLK